MTTSHSFAVFAAVRERLGQALARRLAEALLELADALENQIEAAPTVAIRQERMAVAALLRSEQKLRTQRAVARLFDLSFKLLEANQARPQQAVPALDAFAPAEAGLQALARDMAAGLETQLATELPVWLQRIDALTDVASPARCEPLGAQVVILSVLESLRALTVQPAVWALLQACVGTRWVPWCGAALADVHAWLATQQTAPASVPPGPPELPEPAPSQAKPAASSPAPAWSVEDDGPVAPVGGGEPPEGAALALIDSARIAQGLGPVAASVAPTQTASRLAKALPRPEAIERDAVAFAHRHGVAPYRRAARQHYFAGLRVRMVEAHATPGALAGLDLVAALFDYAVDDERMPSAAMPLMWRMQWPVTALAALDVGFLGDDRRSVRRLVESIAAIAMACADDVAVGTELYRRLETVVRAVEVVANAFQVRAAVLDEQVQREYTRASQGLAQLLNRVVREKQAMESMPGRRNRRDFSRRPSPEREKEVTQRIKARLLERFGDREWPVSVRDFLSSVWLRHMRSAALRDGEHSAAFQVALQVVDDLLWSVDEGGTRPRRSELASRIPQLIKVLVQGVGESGAKPEEFRPFLDELFLIHLRRMQRMPHPGEVDAETDIPAQSEASNEVVSSAKPTLPAAAQPEPEPEAPVLHEQLPPSPAPADSVDSLEQSGLSQASQAMMAGLASELELPPAGHNDPSSQAAAAAPETPTGLPARAEADRSGADQRLLTVLGSLDLDDFPLQPRRSLIDPDAAMARLARGSWLEMTGRDGRHYEAKVAWVNPRRTVVLMVRRADGRAVSLRASELRERFAAKRAVLIEAG